MSVKQNNKIQLSKAQLLKAKRLKVTLVRSPISCMKRHRDCLMALGLKRLNQTKVFENSGSISGLIFKVNYLLHVEEEK